MKSTKDSLLFKYNCIQYVTGIGHRVLSTNFDKHMHSLRNKENNRSGLTYDSTCSPRPRYIKGRDLTIILIIRSRICIVREAGPGCSDKIKLACAYSTLILRYWVVPMKNKSPSCALLRRK